MPGSILLCADEVSVRYPETLGLAGEDLLEQPWLNVLNNGEEARRFWQSSQELEEAWVVSADDIDAINIAATCKSDRPELRVCLISFSSSGSCRTRAERAQIDAILDKHDFVVRYAQAKRIYITKQQGVSLAAARLKRVPSPLGSPEPSVDSSSQGAITLYKQAQSQKMPSEALSECRAFFLPVVSGSGGSGKSTIAVLAALIAQSRGYKTLLIDLDMQFGNASTLLGVRNALYLEKVIEKPELIDALEGSEGKPALIAAPRTIEASEMLGSHLPELLRQAFNAFDVVIANTGSFWTEQHVFILEQSTKALFLVDQRPSSLQACKHALELCSRCGIAASPFVLGVNRCGKSAIYSSIDVSCSLHGMPAVELRDGGNEVEECLAAGQPLELLEEQNELCKSIDRMLSEMLPEPDGHASRMRASSKRHSFRLFGKQGWRRDAACL